MTKFYLIAFLSLAVLSCKTASKAYEKGNYAEALERAVKKLQKDPYDVENMELAKSSYKYAVMQHEDRIRSLSNTNNENRFEQIYNEYNGLQRLYTTVLEYPPLIKTLKATDYSSYVQTYKDKAADIHYEKALKWMEKGEKSDYREAYREFNLTLRYRPDNIEIRKQMQEAYDLAVTNVLVVSLDNYGGYMYSNSYQIKNFQNDIIRSMNYNLGGDFVKFYSELDARGRNIEPDQIIEMRLGRFDIGRPYDQNSSREVSKKVVVKETVHKPDSVVKEYATVRARITTTKRNLVSEGDLYVTIRDTRNRVLWNDNIRSQHQWKTEFASFTGDERALSDSDKALLNQREQVTPREEEIIEELLRRLQSDLSYRVRNYYNRYQ